MVEPLGDPGVLYCLPPAGAGPEFFRRWPPRVARLAVRPLAYPGHPGGRPREPLARLPEIAVALADDLGRPPRRWALFGHSMGAAAAFALAREWRDRYGSQPAHLVASGRHAPHRPPPYPPLHDLPEAEFLAAVTRLGGTPPEVLEHPELRRMFEPLLRADFTASERYRWDRHDPLDCPVTAVVAAHDNLIGLADPVAWRSAGTGAFRVLHVPGDHFHPREPSAALLNGLGDALADVAAQPAGRP